MTTIEKLQEKLNEKNIQFEISDSFIGIKTSAHVWSWYRHLNGEHLLFDHTYSQNTGKSNRGVMNGIRRRMSLKKKTGITI